MKADEFINWLNEQAQAKSESAKPTKQRKPYAYTESGIQQACVRWFRLQYPIFDKLLFHIPNERLVTAHQGKRMNDEGRVSGVADLFLLVPSNEYHALLIEVKTEKGRQNPNQKEWQKAVERMSYKYVIIRSLSEFQTQIKEYLRPTV